MFDAGVASGDKEDEEGGDGDGNQGEECTEIAIGEVAKADDP
jgi:hypothetical protein